MDKRKEKKREKKRREGKKFYIGNGWLVGWLGLRLGWVDIDIAGKEIQKKKRKEKEMIVVE